MIASVDVEGDGQLTFAQFSSLLRSAILSDEAREDPRVPERSREDPKSLMVSPRGPESTREYPRVPESAREKPRGPESGAILSDEARVGGTSHV